MKAMLLAFRGVWFSVVALTNIGDALKNLSGKERGVDFRYQRAKCGGA